MTRSRAALAFLLALYLCTGLFIVRGNEKAVVRRCGRVLSHPDGGVRLIGSGLHYDLPWPLSKVDRVNPGEMRTMTIGNVELETVGDNGFLQSLSSVAESQFLTGDKNILNLQLSVLYRVSERDVRQFLFGSESPERHLRRLVESNAADLISRSGVDFVHPLGLGELQQMLTQSIRGLASKHRLGLEVEDVTINAVHPPVRVKAFFLDVSNARADKQNYINAALAYAESRQAAAHAEARQIVDQAEIYRRGRIEEAGGAADSFTRVIAQLEQAEREGIQTYAQARQMTMRRRFADTMDEILQNVANKVFLDSGKPVDLTIFHDPNE